MKKVILGLLPLCVGCASVHTEIVIEAPAENVWSVIVDTESYPDWNPVMIEADGKHEVGKTLLYQVQAPGEEVAAIKAKVLEIIPNRLLRQSGGIWGVLTFDHRYQLEEVDGGTKVIQHEDYSGIGLIFWDHKIMAPAYRQSNEALRQRVLGLKN